MTVVLDRPYEFVPPYRGNLWPSAIQNFRLIDWHLRKKEAVLGWECRNIERFSESLKAGRGIILAPNHCRYADPIVLGWLARQVHTHLYAMASWHLFNTSKFEQFALRRMGAFSVFREGNDRKALETAIDILVSGERPLVLFPEGTTNRTNDILKPLLDGVSFIARSAAKKRAKQGKGQIVIHPVGLKYLCLEDAHVWAHEQLAELERTLSWRPASNPGSIDRLLERLLRVSQAYLALKEIEFTGHASCGELSPRRDRLIEQLLVQAEERYTLEVTPAGNVRERVRKIRAAVSATYFATDESHRDPATFRRDAERADLAQFLLSFPDEYLTPGKVTDTRIVETIQRIQEAIFGKAKESLPMKVVIDVAEAIPVPAGRPPRGEADPVLCQLRDQLHTMVTSLSYEAKLLA